MISLVVAIFTDTEMNWEVVRRVSPHVLVSKLRSVLELCPPPAEWARGRSDEHLLSRRSAPSSRRPDKLAARAPAPGLAAVLIRPRSWWQSCLHVHLTISMFACLFLVGSKHPEICCWSSHPARWVCVQYVLCVKCAVHARCIRRSRLSAAPGQVEVHTCRHRDTVHCSRVYGRGELIHLLIPLCAYPLPSLIRVYVFWFPNSSELKSLHLRSYQLVIGASLKTNHLPQRHSR